MLACSKSKADSAALSLDRSMLVALCTGNYQSLAAGTLHPASDFDAPAADMDTTDLLVGIKRASTDMWSRAA